MRNTILNLVNALILKNLISWTDLFELVVNSCKNIPRYVTINTYQGHIRVGRFAETQHLQGFLNFIFWTSVPHTPHSTN